MARAQARRTVSRPGNLGFPPAVLSPSFAAPEFAPLLNRFVFHPAGWLCGDGDDTVG